MVAGKSGTSSDYRDSWFAGFSGSHLVVVWVGYDDNQPTGFTGSAGALPVWARVMAGLGTRSWDSAMPEILAEVQLEYPTGCAPRPAVRRNWSRWRCRSARSCRRSPAAASRKRQQTHGLDRPPLARSHPQAGAEHAARITH